MYRSIYLSIYPYLSMHLYVCLSVYIYTPTYIYIYIYLYILLTPNPQDLCGTMSAVSLLNLRQDAGFLATTAGGEQRPMINKCPMRSAA